MVDSSATSPRETSRLRQIAAHNWTATALAFITTIGFFFLIAALLLVTWAGSGSPAPAGAPTNPAATTAAAGTLGALTEGPFHNLLNTLVGIVGTGWATIIGYYFGSSTGSRQKTETLSQVALRPADSEHTAANGSHGQATHPTTR
jgi:hypothetical protein